MKGSSWNVAYSEPAHDLSDKAKDCLPLRSSGSGLTRHQREIIWDTFRSHTALRTWPEDVLNDLILAGQLQSYNSGTLVYQENSHTPCVDIILSGVLEWGWTNADGTRVVEEFLPPGEVINLTSVFIDQCSIHDQRARGLTRLFHIPFETFRTQVNLAPNLLPSLVYMLAVRKRELHNRLRRTSLASFRARLASRLLILAERFGQPDQDGIVIRIRISQEDLAALVMASRQHTHKQLRWFIEQGIIRIRYGRITVLKPEQLSAISKENEPHFVR